MRGRSRSRAAKASDPAAELEVSSKMKTRALGATTAIAALALVCSAGSAWAGSIKGKVTFAGDPPQRRQIQMSADPKCEAGDMERAGRAVHGDGMLRSAQLGHSILEGRDGRALCQEVRFQDRDDSLDVLVADRLAAVGYYHRIRRGGWDRRGG